VAKTFESHEHHFLTLAQRILQLDCDDDGDTDDPVFHAINHPVGHVTQALLDWWYRREPDDGQGLPKSIKPIFTALCESLSEILCVRHTIATRSMYAKQDKDSRDSGQSDPSRPSRRNYWKS